MGLSGPRNRRKLDHDPNNTKWTRDETTFGQKILRAQGWEPGKFLGAQDSSHAQLHTAASMAPIKVSLKDDTLGLGAKIRQKQSDECTGLDVFKDLLGRLNGKSEETLQKEREIRSEFKTNLFVERKYGPMRFVSGGLLVGDQMKMAELMDNKSQSTSEATEVGSTRKGKKEKKEKKDKKRKLSESEEADTSDGKREKKRKRSKAETEQGGDGADVEKPTKRKKGNKEKKSKRSERTPDETDAEPVETDVTRKKSKKSKDASNKEKSSHGSTEALEAAAPEKPRREKKKDKKRKQAGKADASGVAVAAATASSTTTVAPTPQGSGSSTPRSTDTSTAQALSARHLARSRYIASKKLAFSDMQALNQIFMVKPV